MVRLCRRFAVAAEVAELLHSAASSSRSAAEIAGMCAAGPQSLPLAFAPTGATLSLSSAPVIAGCRRAGSPGLVRRKADPSDSRAVTVVLTDQGRATFGGARPHHVRELDENLLSILTEVEFRQLARSTTKLLASAH